MITAKQKPLQEIGAMIRGYKRILVFSCNTCVAVCHAGGNKEGEVLSSLLNMLSIQRDWDLETRTNSVEKQCEDEDVPGLEDDLNWADAILSTACGAGVQFSAEKYREKPVLPALDTCFIGVTESRGLWTERCQACGNCLLGLTAGICPISRCAKRLMNGPCGGSTSGKCEIDSELDCAWQLIIERLKKQDKLELYEQIRAFKDWSTDRAGGPRYSISREENSREKIS